MSPFPRSVYAPLEPYAPDRRPIEVDLSDNTNRWGAHPAAMAAVRGADPEELLRYPTVYADRLREAVARLHDIPPECVSTGCGSDDLLDSTFRAAGEPGEKVAYLPPTFSMVEIFARMNGLKAVAVVTQAAGDVAGEGAWAEEAEGAAAEDAGGGAGVSSAPENAPGSLPPLPDPEALVEAARSEGVLTGSGVTAAGGGLVYLCRPNNPTGELQPRAWVEALIESAEARGDEAPVVLLDEAYADYAPEHFVGVAAASRRVVVVRTLSKLYGLAGLRVGYAVGAPQVIREIEKSRGPYKVNRLAEAAAVAALEDAEGWIPEIRAATLEGRARLAFELASRGYTPLPSKANFILVPVDDAVFVTASLRHDGVAVRPFPGLPGIGDAIRVSIGPEAELDRFLAALDKVYG
jgi:histidinol-phosphate/aromatic aminotransferase/cobyric acid decarboxylase-like protein